jgi:5-hydroxytryptamine receptor 4
MVSLITLLAFAMPNALNHKGCLFFGGEFVIFITVTSFIFPVAIMAWAYWRIFLVAHAHAVRIQAMVPSNQPVAQGERHTKMKGELKAAKTLTIIMGTHIICWCPLFIYFLVVSFCKDCNGPETLVVNYIILVLRYCNTLANPIIYTGINRQFRAAIEKFVLRKRGNEDLSVTVYTQAT